MKWLHKCTCTCIKACLKVQSRQHQFWSRQLILQSRSKELGELNQQSTVPLREYTFSKIYFFFPTNVPLLCHVCNVFVLYFLMHVIHWLLEIPTSYWVQGLFQGILAQGRGSTDQAQPGMFKNNVTKDQHFPVRRKQARLYQLHAVSYMALTNKKIDSCYDHFYGNRPYVKIPTYEFKPIRSSTFPIKLPCLK